jgi:hypothetical protein
MTKSLSTFEVASPEGFTPILDGKMDCLAGFGENCTYVSLAEQT